MSRLEAAVQAAPVFTALGDPTRLSLVITLADGEARSIVELSRDAGMTRQAVTKHLRVLEGAGLVAGRRAGRETRFVYQPEPVTAAAGCLESIGRQWESALGRLKLLVEDAAAAS